MSIEENIKVLDEIAEGFEKLSAEVCARTDLRAMWEGREKGIRQAIALIKAHLKGQSNDPLTPEQLLEMDGEPVYLDFGDGGEWVLVRVQQGKVFITHKNTICAPANILFKCGGKAYRRKPEEETE